MPQTFLGQNIQGDGKREKKKEKDERTYILAHYPKFNYIVRLTDLLRRLKELISDRNNNNKLKKKKGKKMG